jgi:hypothetical protein
MMALTSKLTTAHNASSMQGKADASAIITDKPLATTHDGSLALDWKSICM